MNCPICCKKLNKNDESLVLENIRYHERCVIQAIHITNHLGNLLNAMFEGSTTSVKNATLTDEKNKREAIKNMKQFKKSFGIL